MDWAEQVSLFQSASLVVGPHGAGLSNLVFTPTGATLIELTNGNQYNRCFEWICHVVGHRYLAIAADPGTKGSEPAALAAAISAQL
jgi:capsular polysaccharide biosynthesis protein